MLDSVQHTLARFVLAVRDWSDRVAARPATDMDARTRLLYAEGEPLPVEEVAPRLGITTEEVEHRRVARRLLALHVDGQGYLYPSWQLDPDGPDGFLPGLRDVLEDLHTHDPVMQLAFFVNGSLRLHGASPLAELRRGNIDAVRRAARTYGEQGAA